MTGLPPERLPRLVNAVAAAVALAAVALPPLIYLAVAYSGLAATAQMQARFLAEAANAHLAANPRLWRFDELRFSELLARHVEREDEPAAHAALLTSEDSLVAQAGRAPGGPAVRASALLFDAGVPVGRVEVSRSAAHLLAPAGLAAAFGAVIALLSLFVLRVFPLRVSQRALEAVAAERRHAQHTLAEKLTHHAMVDALTGLASRAAFERRVEELRAVETPLGHALCYIDLDQFKIVNDTCGHAAGDELLRRLAARLQGRIRKSDLLARLGGDEFGVLLMGCPLERARSVAEGLLDAIRDCRFEWKDKTFRISASIGVSALAGKGAGAEEILSAADAACHLAKRLGRSRVELHAPDNGALSRHLGEMGLVHELTRALDEDRFTLYFQRIAALGGVRGRGEHLEILLRLTGQDGKPISPGEFIPAAERYGLMPEIDRWVIRQVFARYRALTAARPMELVAINLSGHSLGDPGLVGYVLEQAKAGQVAPAVICFELTETAALNNPELAVQAMRSLREAGFRFAIDDFGSGFASFAYLKTLPVQFLKLDGSYVRTILEDPVDRAMVSSINGLGHLIGVRTVAEWVEDASVLAALEAIGVDYAQGYGVEKPRPLSDLLERRASEPAAA